MGNVDSKDIPQYGNDQKDFARDASSSKKLKLDPIHFSVETSKVSSIEEQDKDNSSPDKTEDIPDPVSAAAKELSEVNNTYKEFPIGAASGMSRCHFCG